MRSFGSSPLAWGRRPTVSVPAGYYAVHPHSRGVDALAVRLRYAAYFGSSPLAWGRRLYISVHCFPFRFIPTRVGSTTGITAFRHLHARFIPTRVGSTCPLPVRVRSSTVHPHSRGVDVREMGLEPNQKPVHPHSRGVDVGAGCDAVATAGSSPLAWGRPFCMMKTPS